ncbi:MAG: Yip1 family protein [Syntrophomonadaceae bacterium]|nr:Yip1 family protein [Syntrophomonadaceae bacterium]MDD3271682.1 Yip1 family protein [Syntrophomonadaceae bacterium]
MSLIDTIYGIFFDPVPTLQYLAREKPLLPGLLVYLVVFVFNLIINRGLTTLDSEIAGFIPDGNFIWVFAGLGVILSFFILALTAGLLSLLSEIFYQRGNASGLLVCLSFAVIPGALGPPLQYGATLLGVSWLGVILSLLAVIWVLVLQVLSLREALELQTGQAVLLFILPGLLVVLLLLGLIFIIAQTMPSFPG